MQRITHQLTKYLFPEIYRTNSLKKKAVICKHLESERFFLLRKEKKGEFLKNKLHTPRQLIYFHSLLREQDVTNPAKDKIHDRVALGVLVSSTEGMFWRNLSTKVMHNCFDFLLKYEFS